MTFEFKRKIYENDPPIGAMDDAEGPGAAVPNNREDSYASYLKQQGLKHDLSDAGNAERFVAQHGSDVRYVAEWKTWLMWDDQRWKIDGVKKIQELAKETAKSIHDEASWIETRSAADSVSSWANQSRNRSKLNAMLELTQSVEGIARRPADFDADHEVVNTASGVIDLRTGELTPHDKDRLLTKVIPVEYDPDALCPNWDNFVSDICCGDDEFAAWLQRAIGYSFTGSTDEQCFFICHGTGSNGKTTLFEILKSVAGDYAGTSDMDAFTKQTNDVRSLEAIGRLRGLRLVTASESAEGKRFNEAVIKNITGGDTLQGSALYGNRYTFVPEFKLWMGVNHPPNARDASHGFWRRVKVIPFNARFDGTKLDPRMAAKLGQEKPGILKWIVEGAIAWNDNGLGSCSTVDDASNEYRDDQDHLSRFVYGCLIEQPGASISARELFKNYSRFCGSENIVTPTEKHFCRLMTDRNFHRRKKNSGMCYENITLNEQEYRRLLGEEIDEENPF